MNEMVSLLCQSTIDPNSYGTSLSITGPGGFGKTCIVTALCHHPEIKDKFTDGIVFIELGPKATDPSMKLSQLYHLLTGEYLKQGDINHAEQEISQLTSLYCHNLLVIIDDVWQFEDAEPIVKAFSNCKIVLTTRMNDIEQYIPTKHVVSVGPMEQSEAISLLTFEMIDISQLSQEDVSLLEELAQDVHLWPLLLSLIRGQLSHNLRRRRSSHHDAIQNVQAKLRNNGLTAFDNNNIERSRKYAVKICIEVTLELLTKPLSDKIKSLILYNGIGTSLQAAVLHRLWNITEHEARDIVDVLWGYGLVQFTDITLPPHNNIQHCVEVHAVISQYIIENMDSDEVHGLSPAGELDTTKSIDDGLTQEFLKCTGVYDLSILSAIDFLKFKQNEIENLLFPFYLKKVNLYTTADPHDAILLLQEMQDALKTSPSVTIFFPSLNDEINSLIGECHKVLKDAHRLCRKLNQNVQQCLTQKNYQGLIQTIEAFNSSYPIAKVAEEAVTMMKKIILYCDHRLLNVIVRESEVFQMMTRDYHEIALAIIPLITLRTKELQKIHNSLQAGSPNVEATQQYFLSGQSDEEFQLLRTNYLIKVQEIAPIYVQGVQDGLYT